MRHGGEAAVLHRKSVWDLGVLDDDRDSVTNLHGIVFALVLDTGRVGDSDVLTDATILVQDGSRDVRAVSDSDWQSCPLGPQSGIWM